MRINTICLSWFRGAAAEAALEANSKSVVVYGPNGSGKSSFVDAVEYVLEGGRIGHLSHEYSGRRQEKGVLNTHGPSEDECEYNITFADESKLRVSINRDGSALLSGADHVGMPDWDYKRTVLRQDEVAAFISARKGDKYSALLPLLNLQPLEIAAENLRQLAKTIEQRPSVKEKRQLLHQLRSAQASQFNNVVESQVWILIRGVHKKYLPDADSPDSEAALCYATARELARRISELSSDQQRYYRLLDVKAQEVADKVGRVRSASLALADRAEPLLDERLGVLQAAASLAAKLPGVEDIMCPACGRRVTVEEFQAYVQAEQTRLKEIVEKFNERRAALSTLSDALKTTKTTLERPELATWKKEESQAGVRTALAAIRPLDFEKLRTTCSEETLQTIEAHIKTVVDRITAETAHAPPDVQVLSGDKQKVDAATALLESRELEAEIQRVEKLVGFVEAVERQVRQKIKARSSAVIEGISSDVQRMRAILHPGERIEDVRLYVPDDTDKAIDIALRFYGVDQESPRLTLSEGA